MPASERCAVYGDKKYMKQLQLVANKQASIINIELEDLREHFSAAREQGFLERVKTNTHRYVQLFTQVIDKSMPQPSVEFNDEDFNSNDFLMQQRRQNAAMARQ